MKVLLTGFEPFGRLRTNPSGQIVEKIAARRDDVITAVLPTEFRAAGTRIRRLIRAVRPDAIICLGVAASRATICLERVALNLDDDVLPDNAGQVRIGCPIARQGPLAYASTLPLKRMHKALARHGFPATISNHAGAYVCNHVFYLARHEVEHMRSKPPCGLIHVPLIRRRGKQPQGITVEQMAEAVEACIGVLRIRRGFSSNQGT